MDQRTADVLFGAGMMQLPGGSLPACQWQFNWPRRHLVRRERMRQVRDVHHRVFDKRYEHVPCSWLRHRKEAGSG